MTCIVGLVDGGTVWMGADSLGSSTCGAYPRSSECAKLFRRGEMLLAWSGEVRVGQILEHVLEIPEHPANLPTMAYLVRLFVPALRAALADGGWRVEFDPSGPSWTVLIGYRGGLYELYSSFQIDVTDRPYLATGCATAEAHGSLYSTAGAGIPPMHRVELALRAAAEHDIHVAPPFVVESIG
jgi:hypothetical protein